MISRRAVTALFVVHLIAFGAFAQSSAEYGRATSGEIVMTAKDAAPFSGSLELSLSNGGELFGRGALPAYAVTAGATLLQDRLWFFGSATRQERASRFTNLELPENATTGAIGARVDGQLGSSQNVSAFFESARRPELSMSTPASLTGITPSSFLSLRYDGIISSNAFFSASFTSNSRTD